MIVGIILAAGRGVRFGGRKQHELIAGVSVLKRAFETAHTVCDHVIIVHEVTLVESIELVCGFPSSDHLTFVPGGSSRSASVRAALRSMWHWGRFDSVHDIIVVHDAARPLASEELWRRVITAVDEQDAICAVPTIPVTDSIRRRTGQPANRDEFWIVQTPQAFRAATLYELHETEPECSDDAGLLTLGVTCVPGETSNMKITQPGDLEIAASVLRQRSW